MTLTVSECSVSHCKNAVISPPGGYFEEMGMEEAAKRFPLYLCQKHTRVLRLSKLYITLCNACGNVHYVRLLSPAPQEISSRVLITKKCARCAQKETTEYFTPNRFIEEEDHHDG